MTSPGKKTRRPVKTRRKPKKSIRRPSPSRLPFKVDRKCGDCPSLCCRYVAIELDTPRTAEDYDNLRWYLAHEGVSIYVQDRKWHLCMDTPCKYISSDGFRCTIHDTKPALCRQHDPAACEFNNPEFRLELELKSCEDLAALMKKKGLKGFIP